MLELYVELYGKGVWLVVLGHMMVPTVLDGISPLQREAK